MDHVTISDYLCLTSNMIRVKPSHFLKAMRYLFALTMVHENAYQYNLRHVDHVTSSYYLCLTNTQWKYNQGQPKSFPKGNEWNVNGLAFFVGAKLLPTIHFNNVKKKRAYMVNTILNGGLFDVGVHICYEIEKLALGLLGRSRGGLWFPYLISQLCKKTYVPIGNDGMIWIIHRLWGLQLQTSLINVGLIFDQVIIVLLSRLSLMRVVRVMRMMRYLFYWGDRLR